MVLLGVSDTARAITFGPVESRGNIIYKFVNAEANVPIMMQNLEDPVPKVIMIHALLIMVTHKMCKYCRQNSLMKMKKKKHFFPNAVLSVSLYRLLS